MLKKLSRLEMKRILGGVEPPAGPPQSGDPEAKGHEPAHIVQQGQ